jgi:hypothetical protein
MSMVILILKSEEWKGEFFQLYGFPFDELEFDDPNTARNLDSLSSRLAGKTLDQIGKEQGVTRERIRQIIKKLLSRAEEHKEYAGFNIKDMYESRLIASKKAPQILEQKKRTELEKRAIQIIENNPGIRLSHLSSTLGADEKLLSLVLQRHTKKFIYSEEKDNANASTFSDEELLEALRLAEAFESPTNRNLYDDLVRKGIIKAPGSQTIMKRFGTWNRACDLANVSHNESARENYERLWTEEEVLDYVIEFLKNRNYGPGIESYDYWRVETFTNAPSGAHTRNTFITWINAKNMALKKMREEGISPGLLSRRNTGG